MNFSQYKATLKAKFEKLKDTELFSLEGKFRDGGEIDAADTCSEILLQRRNRPILGEDEYNGQRKTWIGFTDEEFMK